MGLYFHTINHTIEVFFKVSFLGFVDAPAMCISTLFLLAPIFKDSDLVVLIYNELNNK